MLSRLDSCASVAGTFQAENGSSDRTDPPSSLKRQLSRSGTEYLNEAYKHFSTMSPTSGPRAEPVLSQIVEELDPYRRAYEDDETSEISGWSGDERSTPPATAHRALSVQPRSPQRSSPYPRRYKQPSLDRFPSLASQSELEKAPLPTFSSTTSTPWSRTPAPWPAPRFSDSPMEVEEEPEAPPLRLEDVVYVNGPVRAAENGPPRDPTPGPSHWRAATPASPRAPSRRGASTSHGEGEASSSPVRRSRRVDEKIRGLLADGQEPSGIYRPRPSRAPRLTRGPGA
ncbi:hypothetical protein C8Q79DRAFT_1012645 [Trametes meyenii]|nr:hypothetical protein C8Q79DRAFT_1012645 [Trametes meyenii]